jgi:hypothetical protein
MPCIGPACEQAPPSFPELLRVLAHRLENANHALIQLKDQLKSGEPHDVVAKTVGKMEKLLAVSRASLVYAGYPHDPFGKAGAM